MKVYLLPLEQTPAFFTAQAQDQDREEGNADPGAQPIGRLARAAQQVRSHLKHPRGRLTRTLKHVWDWLQQRLHPDENLLAGLRTARSIEVYHPPLTNEGAVRALWVNYLRARRRRYVFWLAVNAVLSPLSLVLSPLPGPNVIGYWFAYRAVRDTLIVVGTSRALRKTPETTFLPEAELHPLARDDRDGLDRLEERLGLNGVHAFVARLKDAVKP